MVNVVNLLSSAVSAPTGLWATILNWLESGIVNYGWVIILFTLLVKVCLSPLDVLMKFNTKKSALVQRKLAPQIARINQKYQNDKNQAQLQTNALYKKEGYNVFASCILMIINLVLTMVVFFTLFGSLREMSAYKAIVQYDTLQDAYVQTYNQSIEGVKTEVQDSLIGTTITIVPAEGETSSETIDATLYSTSYQTIIDTFYTIGGSLTEEQQTFLSQRYIIYNQEGQSNKTLQDLLVDKGQTARSSAIDAANAKWPEVKDKWLWIENIWVSDNHKSPLPTYSDLKEMASSSKIGEYVDHVNAIDESLYSEVTSSIQSKIDRWNGFYILAVLAAVTSFLSQWVNDLANKSKNKNVNQLVENSNPNAGSMKFMKILLPAMMVIFVITSSSAFSIYIVASSIISIAISSIVNLIVNACYKKKEAEVDAFLEKEVARSMRKSKRKA